MKVLNKFFVAPPPDVKAPHVKHCAAVLAVFEAATDKAALSFDEVRAALGKSSEQLPDGAIHQIALDAGMRIE